MFLTMALLAMSLAPAAQHASTDTTALEQSASAGDWQRTEALARAAIARDRRDAIAWTYSGFAHDHLGQPSAALHDFAEAVRLSPKTTFVHNNYGASLEANGRKAEAAVQYRMSIAIDPHQPAALINLARLLAGSSRVEDTGEAHRLLQIAWSLAPDAEVARSLLLVEPCATSVDAAVKPDTRVADYAALAAANAVSTPAAQQKSIGDALLRCGQPTQALAYYNALLSSDSTPVEAHTLGRADAQIALGDFIGAGRTLESAVRDGHESSAVLARLSVVYDRTGHTDHAVDALRLALQRDPDNEQLVYQYGMLLLDVPAPKAAEMRVRAALDRNPGSQALWFLLGLSQFDQTQPALAQVSFERSIALRPSFAPALAYRGLCALDQSDYVTAEVWYRKAIAADPNAGDLHMLLAEALEKQHSSQSAAIRTELEKSIALDQGLAPAFLALGRLNLREKDPQAAIAPLQTALKLDSKQRQAHYYLARAFYQLHQPDRAAEETKLFKDEEAAAQVADRAAVQDTMRKLARTRF